MIQITPVPFEKRYNLPKQHFRAMEADMKNFILALLLAVVATAVERPPVGSDSDTQTDSSFDIAQRYCPNGRC